jgi:membrane-associated HD superfamily phosphohydrolase
MFSITNLQISSVSQQYLSKQRGFNYGEKIFSFVTLFKMLCYVLQTTKSLLFMMLCYVLLKSWSVLYSMSVVKQSVDSKGCFVVFACVQWWDKV